MKILTQDDVLKRLKEKQGNGTAAELADKLGISAAYMSEIFRKTRQIPGPVLKMLGLKIEKTVTYTYFELNGKGQSISARQK